MVIGEMAEGILTLTAGYKTIGGVYIKKRETAAGLPSPGLVFCSCLELAGLLFVAVEAVEGCKSSEEAVLFVVDTGGEEQSVGRSGTRIVAEGERPQAIDGNERVVGIPHPADEFVGEAVEGGDPAAAEIADQNGVAEFTEIARGPNNSPGSVKPVAVLQVADVLAAGSEEFDEAEAIATDGVVPRGVLLGVSDEERAADILNVKRSEPARNALGFEGIFIEMHSLKVGVVNFHLGGTEIGDVEKFFAVYVGGRGAFIDGAIGFTVIGVVDDEHGILPAGPAGDRSIFRHENEVSGCSGSARNGQEIGWAAIEDDAGGSREGSSG
jgi:hypothetical protein